MSGHALKGPFLTRREAARRAGTAVEHVARRPDLLRLGGKTLEEVYFAFQFDESGVRPDLGRIVRLLREDHEDIDISHWLVEPQDALGLATPLDWLAASGSEETLLNCATKSCPARSSRPGISCAAEDEWRQPSHMSRPRRRHHVKRPAAIGV